MIAFTRRSIPRRILAALLSIYAVTYLATAVVVFSGVRASMFDDEARALNQLAALKQDRLSNTVNGLATDLTAWSKLDVMNDMVSGDIDKRVAKALQDLKGLYALPGDIYAFNARGALLASSSAARQADLPPAPPDWLNDGNGLVLLTGTTDLTSRQFCIALAIPLFANFDRRLRTGTLVLTHPWSNLAKQLFSPDFGTALLDGNRLLLADPPDLAVNVRLFEPKANRDYLVGRGPPAKGLLDGWQVVSVREVNQALHPLFKVARNLAILGVVLGLPIVLLGFWLSRRLTAPIADLTRVVKEIADTDRLDARVPVTSSDELGSLAQSFNRMTDTLERTTRERQQYVRELAAFTQTLEEKISERTSELEAAVNAQRRLIGDISHEVKSPLARLSMALGLARRFDQDRQARQFDRIEKEINNISALASELLTLARFDGATQPPEFQMIDLCRLVDDVVADAVFENPDRAADVTVQKQAATLAIIANADLLRRAVENVVRNAIFYTGRANRVTVTISETATETVIIEVADDGPGVPDSALEHLFEPFFRVDEARTRETGGSGIGLAICQRVIQAHGGTISARNNIPHGLIVTFLLPKM